MTIPTQVTLHKRLHPTHLIQEIESDDYNNYGFKIRNTRYKTHEQCYSIQSNSITRNNRPLKLLKANRGFYLMYQSVQIRCLLKPVLRQK